MKSWISQWGPALLLMGLIFWASSTPGSDLPKFGHWDFLLKKGGHMLGYALLAAAYLYALTARKISRVQLLISLGLAILYACTDEWHQQFTPGRTPSVTDVLIDTTGALFGLAVCYVVRVRLLLARSFYF